MKIFKFFIYSLVILAFLMLPLYAATRILIPGWLKSQISSSLPPGSSVQFGEIKTNAFMGISISSLIFKDRINAISLGFENLSIIPKLSSNKPAVFRSDKFEIIVNNNIIKFSNLDGNISFLSKFNKENIVLSGDLKSVTSEEKILVNSIKFIIEGMFSDEKNLNIRADNMLINYQSPLGEITGGGTEITLETKIEDTFFSEFKLDNFELDFSNLGSENPNRIIIGEGLVGKVELKKDGNWFMPIKLESKNLSSPQVSNFDFISISAKGEWPNSSIECIWPKLFNNKDVCGRMINLKELSVNLMDDSNTLVVEGDGLCVAPKSGCPQNIQTKINSKGTSPIFSKIMMTGLVNPIVGGILLASLLGSPYDKDVNIDHQVKLEVLGSQIFVNGKKIF